MIGAFMNGSLNAIIFLFTKPSFWILALVTTCVLLVGFVYPGAIYVYPYWQSKVNYVPIGIFDDEPLDGVKTTVVVPSRLLPDAERIYSYTVEFENTSKKQYLRQLWTRGWLKNRMNSAQTGDLLENVSQ